MSSEKLIAQVRSFLERQGWEIAENDEQHAKRFNIQHGKSRCVLKIFSTGTIQVQGPQCQLREYLEKMKAALENDEIVSELLPFEIEAFPETLKKNIPEIDPIIVRFLDECIQCLKANFLLGCAVLLGTASEKAIWLMIDSYIQAISDESNSNRLRERIANKFVSRAYDEFKRSFKTCKTKPEVSVMHDYDVQIDSIFQFCRICRNEVGHPQILPNLDRGVILANMGQFVKYMEALYGLINYFQKTSIVV